MAIAIIMENARVYCRQGILNCHMTFAGSVISLARPESWPRIAMISKKLAIVTIRISATPPPKYVWLARLVLVWCCLPMPWMLSIYYAAIHAYHIIYAHGK